MSERVGSGWGNGDSWVHGTAAVNGLEFHYVTMGPGDGELVLLLHGFPEFWYTWKGQIPVLAAAGFRVIAPDMRGANRSAKPRGISAYAPGKLASDVAGLIDHFGRSSAHVVGHDFGGLVAWHLAAKRPDVVNRLGVLNAPNLSVYDRHLRTTVTQFSKAWYVFFFQIPRLPEYVLSYDDYAGIRAIFGGAAGSGCFTDADIERFEEAAARDRALQSMVSWYRAMGRWYLDRHIHREGFSDLTVSVPTLLCWGEQDPALSVNVVEDHHDVVEDLQIKRYPDATHWVQFDARDRMNDELLEFL